MHAPCPECKHPRLVREVTRKCFGHGCGGTGVVLVRQGVGIYRKMFCGYCYGRGKVKTYVWDDTKFYKQDEVDALVSAAFDQGIQAGQESGYLMGLDGSGEA